MAEAGARWSYCSSTFVYKKHQNPLSLLPRRLSIIEMLDPATEFVQHHSSPTISSISSSDLESASTGSFFHDRSTSLGALMGVTFPSSFAFHAPPPPPQRRRDRDFYDAAEEDDDDQRRGRLPKRRRRWWWGLCGDDDAASGGGVGDSRRRSSASLAEFLEVERRFGEALCGGGDQLEGAVSNTRSGERVLFEGGRVLPPADISNGIGAFRFRTSMGGLCNRGVG